jgi:hypothetical protein
LTPCGWGPVIDPIFDAVSPGIRFNEHIEGDGPTVFAHACKMGLEGIVSKRKHWVKMKNAGCASGAKLRKNGAKTNGDGGQEVLRRW